MLRIRVLGKLELEFDGAALSMPRGRRLQLLFAWLVLHPGLRDRGEVAGSLWPDVLDESARASLRGALAVLRRELGEDGARYLVATRERVGISSEAWVDAHAFEQLVAAGRPEQALALVRGELLEGLTEDWVYGARDRQRDRLLELVAEVADAAEARRDLAEAISRTRELLRLDPLSESSHRQLIRRLAAAGDRTGALGAYERSRERLARELGMAPSAETRRLVEEIRRGSAPGQPVPAASGERAVLDPEVSAGAVTLALPVAIDRLHRSPLVGRGAIVERLRVAWELAQREATRLVLLGGEAGIGKTRVMSEFAAEVRGEGATVLYGRAPEEPLAPYQAFAEALRPYVAACDPSELAAQAGPLVGELGRLLPDQTARLPPEADRSQRDPEGARYRLFEAAGSLLAAAARAAPLLLVIDDLHWADRPTVLLLGHVVRSARASMLVLGGYREGELGQDHPLIATLADLRRDARVERVALGGLVPEHVHKLTAAWLGPDAAPGIADALCGASGGNPFFIEELLRHIEEGGGVIEGNGRGFSVTAFGLPEGVKDVVRARLARLGEGLQVLRLAAVAGREFELELLAHAGGSSREQLIEALDAALDAQLIREAGTPGHYSFNHALVREAVYTELSIARRALLHGRIGVALEQLSADQPDSRLAELAHHFLLAGPEALTNAVEYAQLAGRQAASQLAYESAAGFYERALEAVSERDDENARARRAGLLLELGEALLRSGDVVASRERFSTAAALARELGDPRLQARAALGRSGLSVTVLGVDPENVALLEQALSRLGAADDALRARLLGRLAIEVYYEPPAEHREQLSAAAAQLARAATEPVALADALSARHVALWSAPHLQQRLDLAEEMIALGKQAGDSERELQGRNWRFMDLVESGDLSAARDELSCHAALADRLRLPGYQWWDPMWSAMLALVQGRLVDAEGLRAQALEVGRRGGDKVAELFAWIQEFYVKWERGAEDLGAPPDTVAVQPVQSALRSDLPLLLAEAGRTDEARAELKALAREDFAAVPRDLNWLASLAGLSQAVAVLGDVARARRLYAMLAPYASRAILIGRAAVCLGPVELYLGLLAGTIAEFVAAERHFGAAKAWCKTTRATLWAVWADVHRARMLLHASSSAGETAAAAHLATQGLSVAERHDLGRAASHARDLARAAQAQA